MTILQTFLIGLACYIGLFALVDRICKAFETCSVGKSAAEFSKHKETETNKK